MTGVDICEVCTQEVCATPVQLFRRFQLPRAVPRPPGAQTLSHAHQFDQARTFDPQKSFLFQARSVYIQMMISILMNLVCGQCSCFQANTPRGASLPPHIPSAPPSTLYTFVNISKYAGKHSAWARQAGTSTENCYSNLNTRGYILRI